MNKQLMKTILGITLGSLLMSIAINGIYMHEKLLSGGATGVAMILHFLFDVDISIAVIVINIPIFILGYLFLSKRFMFYSIIGFVIFTVSISVTKFILIPTENILSSILLGSVIYGIGLGCIYRTGASTGGTDIISKILNKYLALSISTVGFAINVIIICSSIYFFGIDISVYTLAAMFLSSMVCNYVVEGINHKRLVLIISNNDYQELADMILEKLSRGVTVIPATGGYTKKERSVLYCVIGITQVPKLRTIVKQIDPHAFVTVTVTSQVYGNGRGFLQMDDE